MITSALPQPMSHERADARLLASSGVGPAQPSAPRLSSRDLLGPAREVEIEHGGHHDHLVCVHCGRVEEFFDPQIEALQHEVARSRGFSLVEHRLAMFGICGGCSQERPGIGTARRRPPGGGTIG